jgi:hypothetical protein
MTLATLPVFFMWSENYKTFADILKACIGMHPYLEDKSLFIEQSVFNKSLYKDSSHFFSGCFFKLEKTLELLNSLPENSYFLVTDVDIIIFPGKPLKQILDVYMDNQIDIVFMQESPDRCTANMGFILIKVCDHNRRLFERSMEFAKEDPNGLDQNFVNKALQEYEGTYYHFPSEFIGTSSTLQYYSNASQKRQEETRKKMMVFHALCDPTKPFENVFMQKIMQYKMLGLPIEFQ